MPLLDDINRLLRDHTGYTGDGQGGRGDLPVGDRSTARYAPSMRDFRDLLKTIAQTMGDPGALAELQQQIGEAGRIYASRAAAVTGAANLPSSVTQLLVREGTALVIRSRSASADDPLFATAPQWGVVQRQDVAAEATARINATRDTGVLPLANVAGAANAITADIAPAVPGVTLSVLSTVELIPAADNTGAVTLNVAGAGAWPVYRRDGSQLQAGDLKTNVSYLLRRRGSTWRLINPANSELDEGSVRADVVPNRVPLISAGASTLLWLEEGLLAARGVSPRLKKDVLDGASREISAGSRVPLVVSGGRALLWLDATGLNGPGLRPDPSPAPVVAQPALASNGRTLHRVKSKIGQIQTGGTGDTARLRIAMMGDSWSDLNTIPAALRALLTEKLGFLGEGWRSVMGGANTHLNNVGFSKSAGWTVMDASSGVTSWPYGSGPDGHLIHTTSAIETVGFVRLPATEIRIYSYGHGGTWRYRVDDGAWQTVTEPADGALRITTITGLTDTTHTFDVDTAGNTGRVVLSGFYFTRPGVGAEILKLGNATLRGVNIPPYAPHIAPHLTDLQPDAVICILGTNDYRGSSSPPAAFIEGISALAVQARLAVPDVGLIFVSPAQSSPSGQVEPLATYRDAMRDWCAENDAEFLDLTDQFGTYAQAQPLGMWADSAHMSAAGANAIARLINHHFLHL